jgi:hypothetical protein
VACARQAATPETQDEEWQWRVHCGTTSALVLRTAERSGRKNEAVI